MSDPAQPAPQQASDERLYVAYLDVLGFSAMVENDFEGALDAYRRFIRSFSPSVVLVEGVRATMYSDAILLTARSLPPITVTVQNLWMGALIHDLMIRGAITYGRYWEERQDGHLFVVSDALVRAVKLERTIRIPAVVVADDVEIPDDWWRARFVDYGRYMSILHFRDMNIVNPFNIMWHFSAGTRVQQLMAKHPAHRDKYLWFLALHKAVKDNELLIPAPVFAKFLEEMKQNGAPFSSAEDQPPPVEPSD